MPHTLSLFPLSFGIPHSLVYYLFLALHHLPLWYRTLLSPATHTRTQSTRTPTRKQHSILKNLFQTSAPAPSRSFLSLSDAPARFLSFLSLSLFLSDTRLLILFSFSLTRTRSFLSFSLSFSLTRARPFLSDCPSLSHSVSRLTLCYIPSHIFSLSFSLSVTHIRIYSPSDTYLLTFCRFLPHIRAYSLCVTHIRHYSLYLRHISVPSHSFPFSLSLSLSLSLSRWHTSAPLLSLPVTHICSSSLSPCDTHPRLFSLSL
ncbi:unnamed protein product [Acanthosepion pharaonis]|uniref:Uncharacterized protein n=1 Tax=Acanthosepion pharaonis TaxID=158019 RepID=A0A812AR01_ACAPH|nr:unnamed protein product [Sepia pharaonis]